MQRRTAAALCLLLAATAVAAIPPSGATANNQGTLKVHDEAAVEPTERNQPHVDCTFWLEGFNMADTSGTLVVWSWAPTGDGSIVLQDNWTGTPEQDNSGGDHFLNGPYSLPAGHYRVEAFSSTGHPGDDQHFSKAKMFWVEPCSNPPPPPPQLACPSGLSLSTGTDGVTVSFTAAPGSDGTNVYRQDADGDWQLLATVNATTTSYTDTTALANTSYAYTVTALFGDRESHDCPVAQSASVPVFPAAWAFGLAAVGALGAVVILRRKA